MNGNDRSSRQTARPAGEETSWVEPVARAGYTTKGFVYAIMGILAVRAALGQGGETGGSTEVLEELAAGPFGTALVGLVAGGLVAYVIWRLVQAFLDPEHEGDDGLERIAVRTFYFGSAIVYGAVAYTALELLVGAGGSSGDGSSQRGAARLMNYSWGVWVLGAIGVGMVGRGTLQFFKAYTASFRDKIRSFELGPVQSGWVLTASRVGLTARGIIFCIIGGFLVHGAVTADPSDARDTEGALEVLQGQPWLLGAVGAGLVGYAVYQWVKARYRLLDVES